MKKIAIFALLMVSFVVHAEPQMEYRKGGITIELNNSNWTMTGDKSFDKGCFDQKMGRTTIEQRKTYICWFYDVDKGDIVLKFPHTKHFKRISINEFDAV
ncbi:hypothetical protein [Burkholderia phage vB_BpP_HN02]|uniref:Uncharacterized protein n=1 Tax=Burkholderia phage vB_BpP_HN02 TaxID=3116925 RepID=A0AAX4JGU3_9CAUD